MRLVENRVQIEKLLIETTKQVEQLRSKKESDGGALLQRLGVELERLTGHRDFSFFQDLPPADTKVVVVRCLCNLYELSLANGCATLTGAFIEAFGRALGVHLMLSNITMACHRKGDCGVEPTGGQAGCVDPKGERLQVLAMVKELQFLGLTAAGLNVVAVIASSNASISSFDLPHGEHFVQHEGTGTYKGTPVFTAPHPKYVSPGSILNSSVALRLGVTLGDRLAVPSAVLEGWACMAVEISSLAAGDSTLEDDQFEEAVRRVYEMLRMDPESQAVAKEWELRHSTETSPETQERLKAALHAQCVRGGTRLTCPLNPITLTLTLSLTLKWACHLKNFASTRDAGEWCPLGNRDSEGWDEAAWSATHCA